MKVNLNTLIYHVVYFLTLISLFFLNNDRTSSNEKKLNLVLSFFTFIFILLLGVLIFNRLYRVNKKTLIYMLMCILCCFVVFGIRSYIVIHWVYLFICFYIAKSEQLLNRKIVKITIFLAFCSVLFQMIYFRTSDGRFVLSYIDPNYSGYFIFCLFLFSWYCGCRKIALCLAVCGVFTLSRNFILAIGVFFLVNKIEIIKKKFSHFNYMTLLLLGYVILFIVSSWYISEFAEIAMTSTNDKKDVTQVVDRSNLDRFTANLLFIEDFSENVKEYFWGTDLESYTNKVFRNSPHNSLLQLILNYGLFFSIFYILILSNLFRQYQKCSNFFPAYASLLVYFLILGGGIYGIQVIWLSFIFKSSLPNNTLHKK